MITGGGGIIGGVGVELANAGGNPTPDNCCGTTSSDTDDITFELNDGGNDTDGVDTIDVNTAAETLKLALLANRETKITVPIPLTHHWLLGPMTEAAEMSELALVEVTTNVVVVAAFVVVAFSCLCSTIIAVPCISTYHSLSNT